MAVASRAVAVVVALVAASCSSAVAPATTASAPPGASQPSSVAAAPPSAAPSAQASVGATAAAVAAASPSAAASGSATAASPSAAASASAGAPAGACTPASVALDAAKAKITAAYDRDYSTAEAFRAQAGAGGASQADAAEAKLAAARDDGIATVTAKAGTGCLDAQAIADLDSATSAAVATLDAAMPSSGGHPAPSGQPEQTSAPGGQGSGGVSGSGGATTGGLGACPSGTLLDASPASAGDVSYVDPLGHMSGAHVLPDQADHIYFYMRDRTQLTPVYSPGKVTLIGVVSQKHFDPTNPSAGSSDYELDFSPCRSVLFWFAHVSHVSDRLAAALGSFPSPQCQTASVGNNGTTNCYYPNLDLALSSGEQIGAAGGPGSTVLAFDFGGVDTQTQAHAFLDTEITAGTMPDSFLHSVCPLDYFTDPIKSALYAQVRNAHPGVNGIPQCSTTMQDKAGTLQGNWYRKGAYTPGASGPFDFLDALAIVHSNNDPALGMISAGGRLVGGDSGQQIEFQPQPSGSIDREPSQVTPGPTVYCYQDSQQPGGRFDLQLVDANTLQIDYVASSTCTASPTLTNPATYTR